MSQLDKIKNTFYREGYKSVDQLRRVELDSFLNAIIQGEPFNADIAAQIWEEASNGNPQASVQDLVQTIAKAQNIIQNRLLDIIDELKTLEDQRDQATPTLYKQRSSNIQSQINELKQEKIDYEEELRYLTEPFGISMADFMASARTSRYYNNHLVTAGGHLDEEGNELQLKWLFFLSLGLGLLQVIVIFEKYDFLNLMVLAVLMFIFVMRHFDSIYIKSTLALLVLSEILDMIWLFMNSASYWNPPSEGVSSSHQQAYLKIIILLTYLGIFIKIPLGVFLFHYRNTQSDRVYNLDIGIAKISLNPNETNPFSEGVKGLELFN